MENKSSQGPRIENHIDDAINHVTARGTGPYVGPPGASVTERKAPGSEGPGRGSATKLNSDDQMPGPAYP